MQVTEVYRICRICFEEGKIIPIFEIIGCNIKVHSHTKK